MARIPDEVVEQLRIWEAERETMSPREIGAKRISEVIEEIDAAIERFEQDGAKTDGDLADLADMRESVTSAASGLLEDFDDDDAVMKALWRISHFVGLAFSIGAITGSDAKTIELARQKTRMLEYLADGRSKGGKIRATQKRTEAQSWRTSANELIDTDIKKGKKFVDYPEWAIYVKKQLKLKLSASTIETYIRTLDFDIKR